MTAKGAEITRSVVHMAQHIHLDVICEGVETAEQVEFLKSIGCDKAQGFYYYPPLPEAEFLQIYLEQHAGGEAEDG